MRANDAVVGRRVPRAGVVLRTVVDEDVVAAALRRGAQQHFRGQRGGGLEVGVGVQGKEAALGRLLASGRAEHEAHAGCGLDMKRGAASDDDARLGADHQRGRPGCGQGQLSFDHDDRFDVGIARDFELTDEAGPARAHRARSFPRDLAMSCKRIVLAERSPAEGG